MTEEDLRQMAESSKEEPWIFFREGLDWCWRSRREVARQVMAGRESLESYERRSKGNIARIVYRPALDLSGVLAGLVATTGRDSWDSREFTDRANDRPLVVDFDEHLELVVKQNEGPLPTPAKFVPLLAGEGRAETRRSIEMLDRAMGPLSCLKRGCMCVSPRLDLSRRHAAVEWALDEGIALVVEPEADLFVQTTLWARPTGVICNRDELSDLAKALSNWADGRLRRFLRLRRVVFAMRVTDEDPSSKVESDLPPSSWPENVEIRRWER